MNKLIWVYIIGYFVAAVFPAYGQSPKFSIKQTDASAYPSIRAAVLVSNATAQSADFKVLEDRKELDFTLRPVAETDKTNRAVFFIVEASGLTYGRANDNIKNALKVALESVSANTLVNIGYFGHTSGDNTTLSTLSAEFTTDVEALKAKVSREINAPNSPETVPEVYKAIFEALEFAGSKENLPADKRLIVISTAINNNRSPIKADDVIEKANRQGIPVYTVAYKTGNRYAPDNFVRISDRTEGQTTIANTLDGINAAVRGYIDRAGAQPVSNLNEYVLEFTTNHPANGRVYQYEVRYQGERLAATYVTPEDKGSFLSNFGTYIFLIVVILAGVFVWLLNRARKTKATYDPTKQGEEAARLREAEKGQNVGTPGTREQSLQNRPAPPNTVPRKTNLRNTVIADSQSSAAVLSVTAGDFRQEFSLDKPQLTVGRAPGNDIVIPEQTVSGKHALITSEGGSFYVTDAGSTNGTYVNMIRISGKQRITPGDTIKMGAAQIKIQG